MKKLLIALVMLLAACGQVPNGTPVHAPASIASKAPSVSRTPHKHKVVKTVLVTRVIDGDTIVVEGGAHVRIIGIDTPEVGQCGYGPASKNMARLVLNKRVVLVPGARTDKDRYGRLLRYVDYRGTDEGLAQIKSGLAIARYDSRDGYGAHPREQEYIKADAASPNRCAGPTPQTQSPSPVLYPNCDAARAAGAAPLYQGDPGYNKDLDGDGDGVACE